MAIAVWRFEHYAREPRRSGALQHVVRIDRIRASPLRYVEGEKGKRRGAAAPGFASLTAIHSGVPNRH